jgi:hypothetical protein
MAVLLEQQHLRELDALRKEAADERAASRALLDELRCTIEAMGNKIMDLEAQRTHLAQQTAEQAKWIAMLEDKSRLAVTTTGATAQPTGNLLTTSRQGSWGTAPPRRDAAGESPVQELVASTRGPPLVAGSPVTSKAEANRVAAATTAAAAAVVYTRDDRARLRRKVVDFYLKHCPEKIEFVDHVMAQWAGREAELERVVVSQPSLSRLHGSSVE